MAFASDSCDVKTAQEFLSSFGHNDYLMNLLQINISKWPEEWANLEDFEVDIKNKLNLIQSELLSVEKQSNKEEKKVYEEENKTYLYYCLACILFNNLHDGIIQMVYQVKELDDRFLFEKCLYLCDKNVTADQFGAPTNYSIHLSAAIVELASLDSHKTPGEKLNCLSTTYDLIFAELKTALVHMISKFSEKENEIPIINNDEIIPILTLVIVKAKLIHLCSNLYYVDKFLWTVATNENFSCVLNMFRLAIQNLVDITAEKLRPASAEAIRNLDFAQVLTMNSEKNDVKVSDKFNLIYHQKERIADLITASTNENICFGD